MISIEIPVTHGKFLGSVLDSIFSQSYQDFEVILVVENFTKIKNVIDKYDVKIIKKKTGLLDARYIGHINSKGDLELILDETRLLKKDSLQTFSKIKSDMCIIAEEDIGKGFWIRLSKLDKNVIMMNNTNELNPLNSFILPRLFRREVLNYAFDKLIKNIPYNHFTKIISFDHQYIFYEAFNYSKNIDAIKTVSIYHYGDDSLSLIIKKFYRYGVSTKIVDYTPYKEILKKTNYKRNLSKLSYKDRFLLYLLYGVRAVPFFIGYYF